MAWVAVSGQGFESIYHFKPERHMYFKLWSVRKVSYRRMDVSSFNLPRGTIEKIIGRPLTWEDEPVKI